MEDLFFEGHLDLITDVCLEKNNYRLFTCSLDGTVKTWDERQGYLNNIYLKEEDMPWGIEHNEANNELIIGLESGEIVIYDAN